MNPYIIAEIGINHNGSRVLAMDLINLAADCGVDAVKFQKRDIAIVYGGELDKERQSPWGNKQREQKQALELSPEDYEVLFSHARARGVDVFASAWDIESLHFLEALDPPFHKIASAMLTHKDFVTEVAHLGRHTFVSTGMSTWNQIDAVVGQFERAGVSYTLLHCISLYPCPDELCNIRMIPKLKERYKCDVGYSGHEVGLLPSILAVAVGASTVERHITLDRAMYGSDQAASLEKRGLELLVKECRGVELALGDGKKRTLKQELDNAKKLRYWE